MIIRVSDIPERGKVISFEIDSEELESQINAPSTHKKSRKSPEIAVFSVQDGAKAEGVAHLFGDSVSISGTISATCQTDCVRCLSSISIPIEQSFEMLLKPRTIDSVDEKDIPDIGIDFYEGDRVNCSEIFKEQLMLSIPFAPSCENSGKKCGEVKTSYSDGDNSGASSKSLGTLLKKAIEDKKKH